MEGLFMGLAYHHKKSGAVYVYSVQNYWDKDKKAPRNKQVCLGRLNPDTGEIIPSKRKRQAEERAAEAVNDPVVEIPRGVTATVHVAGPYLLLEQLTQRTGLSNLLKQSFPGLHKEILSLVYFIVQKGLPLSRSESWSSGHLHPLGENILSQRISEWLTEITESDRQKFLSFWLRKMTERDYLCYDITSISSYAQSNEYIRYGYNRDGESLPQINLAMAFSQGSGLPVFYRRMPGNISDVATLKTTMKAMDFIGARGMHFIMDRGFYSRANVDELLARRSHFTMAVPSNRKWVEAIIDTQYESIASPENYRQVSDKEALYTSTTLYKWGDSSRRTYVHLYYNAARAAEEFDRFTRRLLQYRQELEAGDIAQDDERYVRFFIVKETPKRGRHVTFNDTEIQKYRKRYVGFFCIISTAVKDPMEVLRIYRAKDVVENCFDDLKNQLDMKRLRIHSSKAMDSRIFLQFLALILICEIRRTTHTDKTLRNLTVREVMESMESLVKITYSGRYGQLYSETNPVQRKIMAAFGVTLPA